MTTALIITGAVLAWLLITVLVLRLVVRRLSGKASADMGQRHGVVNSISQLECLTGVAKPWPTGRNSGGLRCLARAGSPL